MWPGLLLAHVRQQPEDQLDRAEVVELDRPLVVVEAVVGERDRAADRAARVVDEHVDRRRGRRRSSRPARRSSRSPRGRPSRRTRCRRRASISALTSSSFSCVRATSSGIPPAAAILQRRRAADAARRARDHHGLAVDGARERAVLEQVRVEVALPVVPQLRRRRSSSGGTSMPVPASARCVSRPSKRGIERHVLEHRVGDPEVGEQRAPHVLERRAASSRRRGRPSAACRSSACRRAATICGAWPARANVLSTSPARCGRGLTRWKAWPSRPGWCAMWSIAAATQSTGTMFVQPTSRPIEREPLAAARGATFWSALKK